jgi:AcrR family transcriptional regulator
MPHLIDTESRTEVLVDAINEILALEGSPGLTLRRLARLSGVSTSSMLHHYGSREHLLRVAAHRTARARLQTLRGAIMVEGVQGFLPHADEELPATRAWLAWLELWRHIDFVGRSLADHRANERALLARTLGVGTTSDELDAAIALVDGLLVGLCRPKDPMSPADARRVLAHALRHSPTASDVTFRPADGSSW